jgi:hypothetical protein
MDLTQPLLVSFFQQLDMRFQRGYSGRKQYYDQFADLVPSSTKQNVYSWLAELPGLRKWYGPKLARNISTRAYALVNEDWEDTYEVDRNDIDDDTAGIYGQREQLMGDAASRWPDDLMTDIVKAGTTALCFDGQYFFDTDHPVDLDDSGGRHLRQPADGSRALTQANFNFDGRVDDELRGRVGQAARGAALAADGAAVAPPDRLRDHPGGPHRPGPGQLDRRCRRDQREPGRGQGAGESPPRRRHRQRLVPLQHRPDQAVHLPAAEAGDAGADDRSHSNPIVFNQRKWTRGVEARGTGGYTLPFLAIKCTP